jgi:choline dehydrogenase
MAMGEFQAGRGGPLASGVSCASFLSYASICVALAEESHTTSGSFDNPIAALPAQVELLKRDLLDPGEAEIQINYGATGWNPYSESLSELFLHDDPGNYIGFVMGLTHPFSRGNIHIAIF